MLSTFLQVDVLMLIKLLQLLLYNFLTKISIQNTKILEK